MITYIACIMPRSGMVPHNQPIALSTATLNTVEDEELNLTFAALADPTRRAILTALARGDATVNVLAGPFAMSLQAVSRHLKVLEGAGLITRGHQAQFRPCAFRETPLVEAVDWIAETRETRRLRRHQPGDEAGDQAAERAGKPSPGSAFATPGDWAR
jgi:DNA-binding transcriptional ArsR family regulator